MVDGSSSFSALAGKSGEGVSETTSRAISGSSGFSWIFFLISDRLEGMVRVF
jgi:hypothetical protein